eukprot:1275182-Rhodomonas_salina.1
MHAAAFLVQLVRGLWGIAFDFAAVCPEHVLLVTPCRRNQTHNASFATRFSQLKRALGLQWLRNQMRTAAVSV